jgi:WYL_2, Sm-like SH3 beta-barrel fold
MMDRIPSAIIFWDKVLKEPEVYIKFEKKDGSTRYMRCTLNFSKIPEKDHPKGVNISKIFKLMREQGIIHVYDLDKKAWRSVPFERVDWLETPSDKKRYAVREIEKVIK